MVISSQELRELRAAADGARSLHYGPYSKFLVLAAARTVGGALGGGSNVENVNFTLTKHAEEVAIICALRAGGELPEDRPLELVYVAGATPCGSCRQFALEFAAPGAIWIIEDVTQEMLRERLLVELPLTEPTVMTFAEALPSAFVSAIPAAEPAAGPFAPT
jgi:cytidine deaminase